MAQRQSKKAPSGKGATSRNKSKSGDGFHIPGWLWALVGIIAGFAIAQYFHNDAPPERDQVAAVVAKKRADGGDQQKGSESASTAEEKDQMPTFEFYTLLPESEVIAPNVEDYNSAPRPGTEGAVLEQHARRIAGSNSAASVSQPSSGQTASKQNATASSSEKSSADSGDAIQQMASRHEASSSRQSAPAKQQSASSAGSGPSYMLQAASFKSQSDANNMAGKLRDLGLVMQVTQVKTADNTTWYRVQAGPYRDSGELARARGLMQTRGIDPMQIQQR